MKSFLPFATQFVEMRQVVCRLPGAVFRGEREAVARLFRIAVDQAQDAEVVQCAGIPGAAVQALVEQNGFAVVRQYVGHGVGHNLHEDPEIPNFGRAGHGVRLVPGMTIAIEPMVNQAGEGVRVLDNDWTVVTRSGSLSAHFEHTIAITEQGPVILTTP